MSRIENITQFFNLKIQEFFIEEFGAGKSNELIYQFQQHHLELFKKNEEFMPDYESKRHGINPIFIMALYKTFPNVHLDTLKEYVMKIYEKLMDHIIKEQVSTYEKIPYPWSSFVGSTLEGMKDTYFSNKFQAEVIKSDEEILSFDIHRCFYFEIFQKNGMPELGPIQCSYDLVMANPLERWIRFERKETIADGNSTCTFRYYPKR